MPNTSEKLDAVKNKTRTLQDGVEVVTGPDEYSNNVPLADWGTLYRPDPKTITDFLGADAHGSQPQAAESNPLAAQGYVPPSNHWGDNLVEDDSSLSPLRTELIQQAAAGTNPTTSGAVSVSLDDMVYDPEAEAGDVIPDRDKEDSGGEDNSGGEVEETPPVEPDPEPEPDGESGFPPLTR